MILDNIAQMQTIDKSKVYDSVLNLAKQCQHAYDEVMKNPDFKAGENISNMILSGMGGSGLAARVIKPLYKDKLSVPVELINSYTLPDYVDKNSFVLVSSYSGNTEETLSTAYEAKKRGACIFAICAGGKLYDWAKANNVPVYKINPKYNPCGQPRMAIGYSIFGQLTMLSRAGFIKLSKGQVKVIVAFLKKKSEGLLAEVKKENNSAKKIAEFMHQSIPVLVGAEHLAGALHVSKNQLNENAKTFALHFLIPELNHHLMEGLQFPKSNASNLKFLFYQSELYQEKIQKRFDLTKDVVEKNKIATISYKLEAEDKLTEVFETIQLGAFWQYYLTMLYGINPAPIPWVDYFKAKL